VSERKVRSGTILGFDCGFWIEKIK